MSQRKPASRKKPVKRKSSNSRKRSGPPSAAYAAAVLMVMVLLASAWWGWKQAREPVDPAEDPFARQVELPPEPDPIARVEVLNGTSWDNWAILAADRLLWEGFDIVNITQAGQTDTQRTTIIDHTQTDKGSPIDYLAAVLRVNGTDVRPADTPSEEIDFQIIVGHDYSPCYKSYWRSVHGATPTPTP